MIKIFLAYIIIFNFFVQAETLQPQDETNSNMTELLDRYFKNREIIDKLKDQLIKKKALYEKTNTFWDKLWSPQKTKEILKSIEDEINQLQKELELKKSENEKIETVNVWVHSTSGKSYFQLGSVSSRMCPVKAYGEYQFFEDFWDISFFLGVNEIQDADRIRSLYVSQNNPYIKKCLENVEEGIEVKVDGSYSEICKKVDWWIDEYRGSPKKYTLSKQNDLIVLTTSVSFHYKGDPKNRSKTFELANGALPCIKNFFAKHGIILNLTFKDSDDKETSHLKSDLDINLWDYYRKVNSENWSFLHIPTESDFEKKNCGIFIHELSHNLGLKDTYPNPDCPDREVGDDVDDIMYSANIRSTENLKFTDQAIKELLAPLCEK